MLNEKTENVEDYTTKVTVDGIDYYIDNIYVTEATAQEVISFAKNVMEVA